MVILQSYFRSYNYQQDKSTYHDCWITLQTALKIAASNLYCKITLVWLDSSLSVVTDKVLLWHDSALILIMSFILYIIINIGRWYMIIQLLILVTSYIIYTWFISNQLDHTWVHIYVWSYNVSYSVMVHVWFIDDSSVIRMKLSNMTNIIHMWIYTGNGHQSLVINGPWPHPSYNTDVYCNHTI